MIRKQISPIPGCVRVCFELPAHMWADHITLVGDFNNWDRHATPLKQDRDGSWRVVLDLASGKLFAFRYLIDGNWQTDIHADGFINNRAGLESCLLDTSNNQLNLQFKERL